MDGNSAMTDYSVWLDKITLEGLTDNGLSFLWLT
jgi:hypothetical protein